MSKKLQTCGHFSETYTKPGSKYSICVKCKRLALWDYRHPNDVPVPTKEHIYAAWLNNRIAESEAIELPRYYIAGLRDARKVFIAHNPLLELVI